MIAVGLHASQRGRKAIAPSCSRLPNHLFSRWDGDVVADPRRRWLRVAKKFPVKQMTRNRIKPERDCSRQSKWSIRILLADREPIFRLGLKNLLALEDDLRVVAEADNAAGAVSKAKIFRPHLVLVQEEIVTESEGLISDLLKVVPGCKVVVIASDSLESLNLRHSHGHAAGIILRAGDPQLFINCARRVRAGGTWFPQAEVHAVTQPLPARRGPAPRPVDLLTHQEKIIISCLLQGWPNREIAAHLSIGEQTVKNHLYSIYNKTGVSDRLELLLYIMHQPLRLPPVKFPALPYDELSEVQDDLLY